MLNMQVIGATETQQATASAASNIIDLWLGIKQAGRRDLTPAHLLTVLFCTLSR